MELTPKQRRNFVIAWVLALDLMLIPLVKYFQTVNQKWILIVYIMIFEFLHLIPFIYLLVIMEGKNGGG